MPFLGAFSGIIFLLVGIVQIYVGYIGIEYHLGAGFAMGFGAVGPGIGDGLVAKFANLGVARDPKNMGLLTRTMIIGQAITETTDIYAIVVSLMLIFVV